MLSSSILHMKPGLFFTVYPITGSGKTSGRTYPPLSRGTALLNVNIVLYKKTPSRASAAVVRMEKKTRRVTSTRLVYHEKREKMSYIYTVL